MTNLEFNKKYNYRWVDGCVNCKYFKVLYDEGNLPICTHEDGRSSGMDFHVVSENCICDQWKKKVEEND